MLKIDVAPAWSGHPVRFQLITTDHWQFVAFYDEDRLLTVAQRHIGDTFWKFRTIQDVVLGWDSHCNIEMIRDEFGIIHLCCNMHGSPVVYYRSEYPDDIISLHRREMIGKDESRTTYPRFYQTLDDLAFTYRDGTCGNGDTVVNHWDGHEWRRGVTMFAGRGRRNAYYVGDAQYGIAYCWRETPDPRSNHTLGFMHTDDFQRFYRTSGEEIQMPMTLGYDDIVDRVPPSGGMLNGNMGVGEDRQGRPVVSYHKFDTNGKTQIYNARYEGYEWKIYQMTYMDYRWDFGGPGTLKLRFKVHPVRTRGEELVQGSWLLNDRLEIVGTTKPEPTWRLSHKRAPANNDLATARPMEAKMLRVVYS